MFTSTVSSLRGARDRAGEVTVKEWLLELVAVPPNVVDLSLPMVSKAYGHGTARK
jgi:hypothetical protein